LMKDAAESSKNRRKKNGSSKQPPLLPSGSQVSETLTFKTLANKPETDA
jgi:hypothetical protein